MAVKAKHRLKRHPGQTAAAFWQRRGATIRYLLIFLAGVLLGSIYAVANGMDSLPYRILVNQLKAVPDATILTLLQNRVLFAGIVVLYLLIAGSCLWGKYMIPAVPLLYGISQGAVVSFILIGVGWNALAFLALCVLLPKTLLLIILILLCNISRSRCMRLSTGAAESSTDGLRLLQIILTILLLFQCFLEQYLLMKNVSMIL